MKVLIACEYSGRVNKAFSEKGHDVLSCDILPTNDNSINHYQGNVLDILNENWDLMIAHPPCTYLSRAGARWLYPKGELNQKRYNKLLEGRDFFMTLFNAKINKIAIENPTPFKIANLPKHNQVIQPFEFGDPYTKRTLLWTKNLDNLKPTNIVKPLGSWLPSNTTGFKKNQKSQKGFSKSGDYSLTFQGIADAMANQWG